MEEAEYKKCTLHELYFPNETPWIKKSKEFFYKNKSSSEGLFPYCKKCSIKKSRQYQIDHVESTAKLRRRWYDEHKELELNRRKEHRLKNYKHNQKIQSKWRKNNADKLIEYNRRRMENKKHEFSKHEWEDCKEYFNNSCAYCGMPEKEAKKKYNNKLHKEHVDHEGSNGLGNCVPACKKCNSSKRTKSLKDWYTEDNENFSKDRLRKINNWLNNDYKLHIKK